jgi:hypothetical protein
MTMIADSPFPECASLQLRSGATLTSCFNFREPNKDVVFSCYMKSDTPNVKATLFLQQGWGERPQKEVVLTDKWERYVFAGQTPKSEWKCLKYVVGVIVSKEGTTAIAAPQLELGKTETPYQSSDFDRLRKNRKVSSKGVYPTAMPIPSATCPWLPKAPIVDGKLDPQEWETAQLLSDLVDCHSGEPNPSAGRVRIGRDKEFLYVSFECPEPKDTLSRPSAVVRDVVGLVMAEAPNSDASSMLTVERTEKKAEWHCPWPLGECTPEDEFGSAAPAFSVAVAETPSGWTAEAAIPLSRGFFHSADADGGVRLNFFRRRRNFPNCMGDPWLSTYGLSAWSCTYGSLRNVPRCGPVRVFVPAELPLTGIAIKDAAWVWDKKTLCFNAVVASRPNTPRKVVVSVTGPEEKTAKAEVLASSSPRRVDIAFAAPAAAFKPEAQIRLTDAETGQVLWSYSGRIPDRETAPRFSVLPEYDYYTSEAEAAVLVRSHTHETLQLKAQLVEATRVVDNELLGKETVPEKVIRATLPEVSLLPWKEAEIRIPDLQSIPNGHYVVRVSGKSKENGEFCSTNVFRKCAPSATEVKISRRTLSLVKNGKGVIAYCAPRRRTSAAGQNSALTDDSDFNTVYVGTGVGGATSDKWKKAKEDLLKSFAESMRGGKHLLVSLYTPGRAGHAFKEVPNEVALQQLKEISECPGILTYCFMDEPGPRDGGDAWKLAKARELFKSADPYHPFYLNWQAEWTKYKGGFGGFAGTDIASLDYYPWTYWAGKGAEKGSLVGFARWMEKMSADTQPLGIPLASWLQIYGQESAFREPTPLEHRAMVYLCLADGIRIIKHFSYRPMSDALLEGMKTVGREIEELQPILADPTSRELARGMAGYAIRYAVWASLKGTYLLAVNPYPFPVEATFDLTEALGAKDTGGETILGTPHSLQVAKGVASDSFAGYEARVYRLAVKN